MAKRRLIDTKFWTDTYIVELDPTEKLIFLYFITSPYSTISGVYEVSLRQASFETGIEKDQIVRILDRFSQDGKMKFMDGWIAIKNFPKHQSTSSSKIQAAISYELAEAPQWAVDWMDLTDKHTPMPRHKRNRVPVAVRRKLLKEHENTCADCGSYGEGVALEVDHIMPVAMGGTNDIENLRILCSVCNGKRNAQMRWNNHNGWSMDTSPIKMGGLSKKASSSNNNNNNNSLIDLSSIESSPKATVKRQRTIEIDGMYDYWQKIVGYAVTSRQKQNREHAGKLLNEYTKQEIAEGIQTAARASGEQFAPRVANFIDLYKKWDELKLWDKRQTRSGSGQPKVGKI